MEYLIGMVVIVLLVAALVVIDRRLRDIREITLMSEDAINRVAEKFDGIDDIQIERQMWRDDERQRGRWN